MKKVLAIATVLLLVLTLFAGCGKEAQEITVKDQKNSVTVTFEKGMTVEELLAQVGLVLGEKDEVTPALDTVLEEPVEVSVARYAKVNVVITEEVKEEATEAAAEESEENEEAEEATTEAAAPATKTVAVELVGGTVADALAEAGIKEEQIVEINVELTDYLSDLDGDILVTVGELKVEEESATTAEGVTEPATEAATEEATTAKTTTTTTTSSYEDDEDDTTTTTRNRNELTTNAPVTEPDVAPTMEPVVTDPPTEASTEAPDTGNNEPATEKYLVSTVWGGGCDNPNEGYVIYTYSDGSQEFEYYEERPDWI